MKISAVFALAVLTALNALAGGLTAQDRDRSRPNDHLRGCENLSITNCAELFWIRERLRDCDGVTPEECPALVKARKRLENCAADQDRDHRRDCAPPAGE